MESSFLSTKTNFSAPVSGSGASGETNPHSTKPLPSGHRARTKTEQFSSRRPLHVLFFFVPGAARFFFSCKRKRNVGRNRSPPFKRSKTPAAGRSCHFINRRISLFPSSL